MTNERILNDLIALKQNGISYSSIADALEIPRSTFYYYIRVNRIPYDVRKCIKEFIYKEYKEILIDG